MPKEGKAVQFGPRIDEEPGDLIKAYCDDNLLTPNAFAKFIIETAAYMLPKRKK